MGNVHHWAVVFSLARTLFAAGHLVAVQRLVELGASVPMPLKDPGPYRNEVAYFTCIRKASDQRVHVVAVKKQHPKTDHGARPAAPKAAGDSLPVLVG